MNSSTTNLDALALQKLVTSIKKSKASSDIGNLICFFEDNLLIWNGDDQCLYVCSLDNQNEISNLRAITLTNPPVFTVSTLTLSPHGDYLALSGLNGLMLVELPRNWALQQQADSTFRTSSSPPSPLLARSTSIGERMFLCNQTLKLLSLRWHPISRKHILILNNDNCLRLFDIENEYEPVKTIFLNTSHTGDLHFERVSAYSNSLGEGAVAFDLGPTLGRFHAIDVLIESLDIFPVFVLRGNGDVLLLFLSLKDLAISNQIFGPLKMTPAAEDNYGSDACSILCLDCVPPVVVIGTSSGLLYHCIAMESEYDEKDEITSAYQEVYSFTASSGVQVIIPESILYVLETIELSFPLTSTSQDETSSVCNNSLQMMADIRDSKRYFCLHSFGVHIVMLSFLKQLLTTTAREYHDDKSIVEYLICTQPTIEKSSASKTKNEFFPIGVSLFLSRGFTYIAVLLNSAQLVCKRLSNVLLPDAINGVNYRGKGPDLNLENLLTPNKKSANVATSTASKATFPQHLEKILQRSTSLPLIKSSRAKEAVVGVQELEMLLNSIDILKKEYLGKFALGAKSIEHRKNSLRNICQIQLNEIDNLKAEKEHILSDYVSLVKKYDQIKESQSALSNRLDKKIAELQYQRPTLSDAERNLKQELSREKENIALYREKFEKIKRKHRYQDEQVRKAKINGETEPMWESALSSQLKESFKETIANQYQEISQLVSIFTSPEAKTLST